MLTRARAVAATVLRLAGLRVELFSLELQEQFDQWLRVAVLTLAAVLLVCLGLGFLAVLLAVAFWDSHPLAVLGACALAFLGAAGWCVWRLSAAMASAPPAFGQTLAEFRRDLGRVDKGPASAPDA